MTVVVSAVRRKAFYDKKESDADLSKSLSISRSKNLTRARVRLGRKREYHSFFIIPKLFSV